MPRELVGVLGEWILTTDKQGRIFWRNKQLGASSCKDPRGISSLFEAVLDGQLFFIQLYCFAGGCPDATDTKGRTALHYSCGSGQAEAAMLLLQCKASVDVQDQGGSTPLHWACRYGHTTLVKGLLEAKASPDCPNALGDTPVHEAAMLGQVDALHWLVLAHANPYCRNYESRTPAQVAALRGCAEAEVLLRGHEAHPCWHPEGPSDERPSVPSPGCGAPKLSPLLFSKPSLHQAEADEPVSPALKVIRAARPVLRGVQWLANWLMGEKRVELHESSSFRFDRGGGRWVFDDGSDDEASNSGSENEMWEPAPRRLASEPRKQLRGLALP